MTQLDRLNETISLYIKHGWQLSRVMLRSETLEAVKESGGASLSNDATVMIEGIEAVEVSFDALWFRRASHNGREAWELRLVEATPYALFETFEIDEMEEDREDVRREMEARLRDYVDGR
jgi:hypothetical protein